MYAIYSTEGIVLGGTDSGPTSRYLYIFTEKFGLIYARAQGIRALKSKLRYNLQVLSYAEIELVRGNYGWRVINVRSICNHGVFSSENTPAKIQMLCRITALLRRLLRGEEENKKLFEEVREGFKYSRRLSDSLIHSLEIVLVMRVLYMLGYWGETETFRMLLERDLEEQGLLEEVVKIKSPLIREINKSLHATQL